MTIKLNITAQIIYLFGMAAGTPGHPLRIYSPDIWALLWARTPRAAVAPMLELVAVCDTAYMVAVVELSAGTGQDLVRVF